jgi:hypothetical protein
MPQAAGVACGNARHFVISDRTDPAGKIRNFRVFHLSGLLILTISTR